MVRSTLRREARDNSSVRGFFRNWDAELGGMQKDIDEEARQLRQDKKTLKQQHQRKPSDDHTDGSPRAVPSSEGTRNGGCKTTVPLCPKAGANAYLRAWHQHDAAYRQFQEEGPLRKMLMFDDIPWPPCAFDVLEFLERLWSPGHPRQAYRIACRRWHPDKFLQLYGPRVLEVDLERVTSKLNDIFQVVSTEWQKKEEQRKSDLTEPY
eukprot:GEMP01070226.1.p2 GENE.GEMP01070226.1~~GEMP01070226.1.p2  ORF type:complete len:208 (+),score=52.83 GEMP01070226.1:93-716(+)